MSAGVPAGAVERLVAAVLARPRATLAACLVVTLVAGLYGAGIELRTSRSELVPPGEPNHERLAALQRELGGGDPLVVAIEAPQGDDADALGRAADAVASALAADPAIASVFHRVDPGWLAENGLHLAPPDDVDAAAGALAALLADGWPRDWAALNDAIAARIDAAVASAAPGRDAGAGRALLAALFDAQEAFVLRPGEFAAALTGDPLPVALLARSGRLGPGGRLATYDGRTLFILATPAGEDDGLPARRALVDRVRAAAASALRPHPGVTFGVGGEPALVVDEMDAVRKDTRRGALLSIVGVTLLSLASFRSRGLALIAVAALAVGVVWALAAARLELGYLNMITSAFLSTLIGVGIAYAVHPVSEYELQAASGAPPGPAVRRAWRATGAAVVVSALTTAGAFLALVLMDFRGFRELGLVAGTGVVLCLAAVLTTLPALVVLHGTRAARRGGGRAHPASPSPLDRLWLDRVAPRICRAPRAVTVAALVLTVLAGVAATGLRFEHDIVDLLPQSAESRRLVERMTRESDLSPRMNLVTAASVDELRRLAGEAASKQTIARFESALSLLPADPGRSTAAAARLAGALDRAGAPRFDEAHDGARHAASLERLERSLSSALDAAFLAGETDAVGELEAARARAGELAAALRAPDPARAAARATAAARLAQWLEARVALLARAAATPPPGPEDLPPALRERLVTRGGRFVGMLHPAGDVFDPQFLAAFNEESRAVDPGAAGFPINFELMSARITGGFLRAFLAGAVLVFVVLLADFRRIGPPLVAMIPLGVGVVWLLGAMRVLGLDFNLANLIALPLILGVGIDNGVHVVHRLRLEGDAGMTAVLRHTGRAILLASLTTMVGFGTLTLASHRGLASLGAILALGIGACLVAALVVLPNLLVALGRVRP